MTKKERQNAKGQDCTLRVASYFGLPCAGTDTTVLCHAPCRDKGMGIKSPDWWAAFGCATCHDIMDGRVLPNHAKYIPLSITRNIKRKAWLRGIYETQKIQREL